MALIRSCDLYSSEYIYSPVNESRHFQNVTKTRTVEFCCPDFEESEFNGTRICIPVCSEGCVNGKCTNPGKCNCDVGFMGLKCDQRCPSNRYGKMCIKYCKCGDNNW